MITINVEEGKVDIVQDKHGIYRHACPNCSGPISDLRLIYKAPCEKCIPQGDLEKALRELQGEVNRSKYLEVYSKYLTRPGHLLELLREEKEVEEFDEFFKKCTGGYVMWNAQRMWTRRMLKRESFSIVAPTGMGKTVFSLITALYKSLKIKNKGRKVYLIFPTTPLLLQAWKKILQFSQNAGISICNENSDNCLKIVVIHSKLGKKERELYLDRVKNGDFDILMTTSAFIHKREDVIPRGVFDLIVLDDVDAVLKSGRAVRRILRIIGLSDEIIDKGLELIKLRARIGTLTGEEQEKIKQQISRLEDEVDQIRKHIETILIVNSATGRPRGIHSKLFRIFLGFEAGSKPEAIRNIVDVFIIPKERSLEEITVDIVQKLGGGALLYVPVDKGIEYTEKIADILKANGIKAEAFHAKKQVHLIEKFANGEIDVLIGVATYYGAIVRGIDLPERVKYTVFIGVPRHKFSSRLEEISPMTLLRMLTVIRDLLLGDEKNKVDALIGRISRRMRTMSQGAMLVLHEKLLKAISTGKVEEETPLVKDLYTAYKIITEKLQDPELLEKLRELGDIALIREKDEWYILIPDVATYIQASGRCSRLYPGGVTKGLSVVIVDDIRLINGLIKRLRWIFEDFKINELEEVPLDELMRDISNEREYVKKILAGEVRPEKQLELTKTALLIVESPNKARTIANFFGKPSLRVLGNKFRAYEVTIGNYILTIIASGGHVYDLITMDSKPEEAEKSEQLYGVLVENTVKGTSYTPIYTDIKRCPNGHEFKDETDECPICGAKIEYSLRKRSMIDILRKLAREVDIVLIGTDPDSEGEKIAWDIRVLLEPYANKIQRVEFHEVTRRAILHAIHNPRDFNVKLVEAQIVRRIEDRWLGFSLSGILQKYAWPIYCIKHLYSRNKIDKIEECCRPNRNLSAGRVQTPVLGFIIEQFEKANKPEYTKYLLYIELEGNRSIIVEADYNDMAKLKVFDEKNRIKNYPEVVVKIIDEVVEEELPPFPFTTDTLLEEASRKLGFSTTKTMTIAQELFEQGFITYHRTDSVRISDVGVEIARQYIEEKHGVSGLNKLFKPRTWSVEGAHEAIRPTKPIDADRLVELIKEGAITTAGRITRDHIRLYDLIFRRFIASQMVPAKVLRQKLRVILKSNSQIVEKIVDVACSVLEEGYLKVYEHIHVAPGKLGNKDAELSGFVKLIKKLRHPLPKHHDIIRWMKTNGIGRPSTYAKIIERLVDRKYTIISKKHKAFVVQERGKFVYQFLAKFFEDSVGVKTTRKLEEIMDKIEQGDVEYQKVLSQMHEEVVKRILARELEIKEHVERELKEILPMKSIIPINIDKCIGKD